MSLYGKYRPQNFANLVGQDHIRETILHEIQNGSIAHAYLFAGPRGTGKTSTARLIAKALNCTNKNSEGEPCDACDFCKTITEGSLIDVIEIDAASNRGIDEIRDLKEKINFAPTRAQSKTYIIDEVHMLSKDAFNAFLKTLEEPPDNVYFILCTTEIHKIPDTIISRCQRFDFKRIEVKTIMTRLSYIAQLENIAAEDMAIELIARHVEGGLRDAIGLLEQLNRGGELRADHVREHLGITGHHTIETLISLLEARELQKSLHLINEAHNEGYDLTSFVREILECLREKMISGIHQGTAPAGRMLEMITRFEEARDMLRTTIIPQLPIEIAVIKICGETGVEQKESAAAPAKKTPAAKSPVVESKAAPAEKKEQGSPSLPELEHTPEAQHEEQKTAATLHNEIELERYKDADVTANWPRVLEHVQPPSLRRSLADAKVSSIDPETLMLTFSSRFHIDKVKLAENSAKIEETIAHIFGKKNKLKFSLDTTRNASVEEESREKPASKSKKSGATDSKEALAKKAMEIFKSEEW